ncbi:hypothetical protein BJ508DRAFT_329288 [Ascobolus immersus RN42]|uniref:F-box domain-containing protein n=1 Tax=Ascobolus immersus RN42 TaxID=1160509 RepID=A0A3N4I0W3_ASCIM|nr:hypothetical protein BJ508DRAFT_329288 [Ascobolus immersus RN42]
MQRSYYDLLLSLPFELRLDIYYQCTAFTLLQLSHTCHFFRSEINSPRARPLIDKGQLIGGSSFLNLHPKLRSEPYGVLATQKWAGNLSIWHLSTIHSDEEMLLFARLPYISSSDHWHVPPARGFRMFVYRFCGRLLVMGACDIFKLALVCEPKEEA